MEPELTRALRELREWVEEARLTSGDRPMFENLLAVLFGLNALCDTQQAQINGLLRRVTQEPSHD